MYSLTKRVVDALLRRVSRALPAWQRPRAEQAYPARAPYQPTLPANLALFGPAAADQFRAVVEFPPYHLYRLRNVHVTWDGAVFHNLRLFEPSIVYAKFASRFQDTLLLRQWVGERVDVPAPCVAVCHDQWSVGNYYHWLIDTLPRLLVLRRHHPHMRLLLPQPLPPRQLPDYVSLSAAALGFTDYVLLSPRQILRAGCVVLPELTAHSLTQHPEYVVQARAELLAALAPAPAPPATRRVYAARAADGVRSLVNEAEVDAVLRELGFEKIYFEQIPFMEQVRLMRETAVFLGVHGAGMTNMLFLPEGARVVELLNEEHGDLCYFRLASCLGLPYFWAPGAGTHPELANQSDLVMDPGQLRKIVTAALGPE